FQFVIHDDDPTAGHQYQLLWGDGDQSTSKPFDPGITSFTTPEHVYRDNGTPPTFELHPVLTVWSKDGDGNILDQSQREFAQVVHNAPPHIDEPLVAQTADEGDALTFEYLGIDPGLDDQITVTTDWGDG